MLLSEHFTLDEFLVSQTALRLGIKNVPPPMAVQNMKKLCMNVLEPLRESLGYPIYISSGFRCQELNSLIGGSPNSQHTKGQAADISAISNSELFYQAIKLDLPFDQLIWEFGSEERPAWVHISHTGNPRKEILRAWKDENGNTTYTKLTL